MDQRIVNNSFVCGVVVKIYESYFMGWNFHRGSKGLYVVFAVFRIVGTHLILFKFIVEHKKFMNWFWLRGLV